MKDDDVSERVHRHMPDELVVAKQLQRHAYVASEPRGRGLLRLLPKRKVQHVDVLAPYLKTPWVAGENVARSDVLRSTPGFTYIYPERPNYEIEVGLHAYLYVPEPGTSSAIMFPPDDHTFMLVPITVRKRDFLGCDHLARHCVFHTAFLRQEHYDAVQTYAPLSSSAWEGMIDRDILVAAVNRIDPPDVQKAAKPQLVKVA
jgi:hypothetical protein